MIENFKFNRLFSEYYFSEQLFPLSNGLLMFHNSMWDDIVSEKSFEFRKLMIICLSGGWKCISSFKAI